MHFVWNVARSLMIITGERKNTVINIKNKDIREKEV